MVVRELGVEGNACVLFKMSKIFLNVNKFHKFSSWWPVTVSFYV